MAAYNFFACLLNCFFALLAPLGAGSVLLLLAKKELRKSEGHKNNSQSFRQAYNLLNSPSLLKNRLF